MSAKPVAGLLSRGLPEAELHARGLRGVERSRAQRPHRVELRREGLLHAVHAKRPATHGAPRAGQQRGAGSDDRGGGRDSNVGGEAPGGALLANWPHSMRPTRRFGYAERSG